MSLVLSIRSRNWRKESVSILIPVECVQRLFQLILVGRNEVDQGPGVIQKHQKLQNQLNFARHNKLKMIQHYKLICHQHKKLNNAQHNKLRIARP